MKNKMEITKSKISEKNKKFIEDFINLYIKRINLEFNLNKDKNIREGDLDEVDKKIKALLADYQILFEDVDVLYRIFNEVSNLKKREGYIFNGDFSFFLEWTFEELYKNNLVNETDYEKLKKWLTKFDIEPYKLGPGALGGALLGF